MKRTFSLILALLFLCGACACTGAQETTQTATRQAETTAETATGTPTQTLTPTASPSSSTGTPTQTITPSLFTETPTTTDTATETPTVQTILTEADVELFNGSYGILRDRITDRGYAATSLTGAYFGMFTRDSSIQAMAHISCGDPEEARAILRYLLSVHAMLGIKYATHILDNLVEEEYRNHYLASASEGEANDPLYYFSQRSFETAIYNITAPDHGAAQAFVPMNDTVRAVEVYLGKTRFTDSVNVSIRTDYADPATSVGETLYTFGTAPDGWQTIVFDEPLRVIPGKTYYLVLQAPKGSGTVVWYGSTRGGNNQNSYNYDVSAFGGWVEKPYDLAFEVLSYTAQTVGKRIAARGNAVTGAEVTLCAPAASGRVRVEIRSLLNDPETVLGSASAPITEAGEKTYTLVFDEPIPVSKGGEYFLVVSLENAPGARVLTDPAALADSFALGGEPERIGCELCARVDFDVDRNPLIALENGVSASQQIPCGGENITAVKVLLHKDEGAVGTLKATLERGEGDSAQIIDVQRIDLSTIPAGTAWLRVNFELPLFKPKKASCYRVTLEAENLSGGLSWCGSEAVDNYRTTVTKDGVESSVSGDAGFAALRGEVRQLSGYTQTDTTFMLIHAWAMYVNNCAHTDEDEDFISKSYPVIKGFADYYFDVEEGFNKKLNLLYNPSLEHSRLGRYWQSYDLITNVFASQALFELSKIADKRGEPSFAEKWLSRAKKIEKGINTSLVTEYDGVKIYGEFYDAEKGMQFYPGVSWVNFAPVAAEWYGMDLEIMKNTYEVYKKYATVKMYGVDGLATDATLGTNEIRRELIGKGVAWELMFCAMIGDAERVEEIMRLEQLTSQRQHLTVYPESWTSATTVSDPGNQEHCAWQVYAVSRVFPELTEK